MLFLHFWSPHTNRLLSFSLLGLQGVCFLAQTTWFHCQANLPLNFTLANYNHICNRGQRTVTECDRLVPGRSIPLRRSCLILPPFRPTLFFTPSPSSGYNDIGLPGVSALARHPPPSRHALRVYSVVTEGGVRDKTCIKCVGGKYGGHLVNGDVWGVWIQYFPHSKSGSGFPPFFVPKKFRPKIHAPV